MDSVTKSVKGLLSSSMKLNHG